MRNKPTPPPANNKPSMRSLRNAFDAVQNPSQNPTVNLKEKYAGKPVNGGMNGRQALSAYDEMFSGTNPAAKKQSLVEAKANDVPKVITKEDKLKMIGALVYIKEALGDDISSENVIEKLGMIKEIMSDF